MYIRDKTAYTANRAVRCSSEMLSHTPSICYSSSRTIRLCPLNHLSPMQSFFLTISTSWAQNPPRKEIYEIRNGYYPENVKQPSRHTYQFKRERANGDISIRSMANSIPSSIHAELAATLWDLKGLNWGGSGIEAVLSSIYLQTCQQTLNNQQRNRPFSTPATRRAGLEPSRAVAGITVIFGTCLLVAKPIVLAPMVSPCCNWYG